MIEYLQKLYTGNQQTFFNLVTEHLEQEEKMFIITANPETLMIGYENELFHAALMKQSTTIIPDGIGVIKAANALGLSLSERITGVELVSYLLREANRTQKRVFLYGSKPNVISALIQKVAREYPGIIISGFHDGYSGDGDAILQTAIDSNSDIILVALGIPNQELLINKHFQNARKGIFVGVGGSFDVISGMKKRAPTFFVHHNLEWLYRIAREPKRIKRFYKSNVKFIWKVHQIKKRGISLDKYIENNDGIRDKAGNH